MHFKLLILIIILVLIYYLIINFTTIRYNLMVRKTQLLDKIKKNKRLQDLNNININIILKIIDTCLEFLQAPFMSFFNSSTFWISKIIKNLIRGLIFVKDILLYYISKTKK